VLISVTGDAIPTVTDVETVRRGYRLSDPDHRTGVRLWPVAVYEIASERRSTILRSWFSIPTH
jgi:hypothetical protein